MVNMDPRIYGMFGSADECSAACVVLRSEEALFQNSLNRFSRLQKVKVSN